MVAALGALVVEVERDVAQRAGQRHLGGLGRRQSVLGSRGAVMQVDTKQSDIWEAWGADKAFWGVVALLCRSIPNKATSGRPGAQTKRFGESWRCYAGRYQTKRHLGGLGRRQSVLGSRGAVMQVDTKQSDIWEAWGAPTRL